MGRRREVSRTIPLDDVVMGIYRLPRSELLTLPTGETIPIRLFLGGFDLTPTFRDVNKKFSVRYYLNLVLIDSENRRYFKGEL